MFQVIFPMKSGTDLPQLKAIMPTGWVLEQSEDNPEKFHVVDEFSNCSVGNLFVREKKAIIKVHEETINGKKFWQAFGMKYPELNPFDLRFGVLYRSSLQDQKFELDEYPAHSPFDVIVDHYAEANEPYYVSFFLGDWHAGEDITTQMCRRIFPGGRIGPSRRNAFFQLGNIENEETM